MHVHWLYSYYPWSLGYWYLSINLPGESFNSLSAADNLAQQNYTTLAGTHLHLGEVKQSQVNFLLKEISSAPGWVRTRDLSIPKRASYHWTTAPMSNVLEEDFTKYNEILTFFSSWCKAVMIHGSYFIMKMHWAKF
jgi:hypothetical protein